MFMEKLHKAGLATFFPRMLTISLTQKQHFKWVFYVPDVLEENRYLGWDKQALFPVAAQMLQAKSHLWESTADVTRTNT